MARTSPALLCALALAACGGGGHSRSPTNGQAQGTSPSSVPKTSAAPSTTGGAAAARPPTCAPSQLRLRALDTQGATGHLEATFSLTNASRSRCRLFGYPGAHMLSANGRVLPTTVKRGNGFFPDSRRTPAAVELAPAGVAHFSLGWSDNNEQGGSPASCPRADRLEVTPPNDYGTLAISVRGLNFAPCNGKLTTSPVYP
jgi:hypothetical protein